MKGSTLDWVIIGGGIHGVHLAVQLLAHGCQQRHRLRIVDPGEQLLEEWRRCTANTGMRYLRSPAVHHLHPNPWSLLEFGGANRRGRGAASGLFAAPYQRPSVELFASHCNELIGQHGLSSLHLRSRAEGLDITENEVVVRLESGDELRSSRVLLAVGGGHRPRWPSWARALRDQGAQVHHIFERGFTMSSADWGDRVAVIGGGISAVQAALRLFDAGKEVSLVARHALRVHQFDSDPGWVGPKNMRRFQGTRDVDQRRALIREARHAGSVPPALRRRVSHAIQAGKIRWMQGDVSVEASDLLELTIGESQVAVDGVLLATGFEALRPGGSFIDELVEKHGLPCASCGFPVVDAHLRWHPRVFVTGPLAELEIGPVARNIVGARRAAERILPLLTKAG